MIRKTWNEAAVSLLFPRRYCLNCGRIAPDMLLCEDCRRLRNSLRRCPDCATFIPATEAEHYRCANCRHGERAYSKAAAVLPYTGHFRDRIIDFKYNERTGLGKQFAHLMAAVFDEEYKDKAFDALIPIPMHQNRVKSRGYDQSVLLAKYLAAHIALPLDDELLIRVKDTPALWDLSRSEREKALSGAFRITGDCRGKTLLLTDDIFTTGATAQTAALALLRAGAQEVCVLTLASGTDK